METRCERWYRINVTALSVGELRRATGGGPGFWLSLPLHLLGKLLGRANLADDLVPEAITAIERPEVELPVPEPVAALGFKPLLSLSLPEFSGRNLVHMLVDEPRETICEFIAALGEEGGAPWSASDVVLASGLESGPMLRTLPSPRAYPTLPPPGHHVVVAPGLAPAALYARHRDELARLAAECGSTPIVFDEARAIDVARRSHRELVAFQVSRGVFVEAAPALVDQLLRDNALTRPAQG